MKALAPILIQPGFSKNLTDYENEPRWVDGDKVRFRDGRAEKIGGWRPYTASGSFTGVARDIQTWSTLQGIPSLAVGTTTGLFALDTSGWRDITPTGYTEGPQSNTFSEGFGAGSWGSEGWGEDTPASQGLIPLQQWAIDNYGEDLLAVPSGGTLYFWDRSASTEAVEVTAAPDQINTMFVMDPTPYVVALGCTGSDTVYNPMLVRWSDGENFNQWDAAPDDSIAGEQLLQNGSKLIGAEKIRNGALLWSDTSAFLMEPTADPDQAFLITHIASECGLIAPHAAQEINGEIFWMGVSAFYKYDGAGVRQLRTPLDEAIFELDKPESVNFVQKEKVYSGVNTAFNEIWWFYPANTSDENSRYVVYNYLENIWYDGALDRTTWTSPDVFSIPFATGPDAVLYEHEVTKNDSNQPMRAFIKTGDFDIGDGDQLQFADRLIPDLTLTGSLEFTMEAKEYPQDTKSIKRGPYSIVNGGRTNDFRIRGRTINIEFSSEGLNYDFKLGRCRIRVKPDGAR